MAYKIYDRKGNATYRDTIDEAEKVVTEWESHHKVYRLYGTETDPAYRCFICQVD